LSALKRNKIGINRLDKLQRFCKDIAIGCVNIANTLHQADMAAEVMFTMSTVSTVKQLAATMGVSTATVSRALNGKPGPSEEVRSRILAEANRLNLTLSSAARSLSTSKTDHVCFAVYHLPNPLSGDPFYGEILMGVEAELRQAGMHTMLEVIGEDEIKDPARWRILRERRADGVILNGPFVPASFIVKLNTLGVPVVLVDNFLRHAPDDAVVCDDRGGARAVADHVLSLGHRHVAIISGPEEWYSNQERCAGFMDAFAARGLEIPTVLRSDVTTFETGQQLAEQALEQHPTAILAVNDAMAMGASVAARNAGLRIPEDLTITGFDDVDMASRWTVPLTTVRVQKSYLGRAAARQFMARCADKDAPQQRIVITTALVIRGSSGAVPTGGRK
jgi:LacI family transcriptional regulator